MKPALSRKVVLLIAFLVICCFSSFLIGAYARSLRTDPFDARHGSYEGVVIAEEVEKHEDYEENMVSNMDYTPVRRKPPIHN
ncbi:unnamed protein product [Trifolium pratense]|uniref:Uncharacterized protein n=1 Tax=Trifolium pratense TaxID=57577 RepID=A0ACB0LAT4_TRIPR|nr:unnamed protein product [Trifolium pratense]